MSSGRMRRVDEAIREVLGEALASSVKDPRVGFITVTDVRTSADLRHARVYVSVLGDAAQRQASLEGLRSAMSAGGASMRLRGVSMRYSCGSGRSSGAMKTTVSLPSSVNSPCMPTSDPSASPSGPS